MTEERKKYLASISVEERAIRNVIGYQKIRIYNNKFFLSSHILCKAVKGMNLSFNFAKREIREAKFIIKALKKQLPAPVKFVRDGKWAYVSCSVCKGAIIEDELYCHNCGQKLK